MTEAPPQAPPLLRSGSQGEQVRLLQEALRANGHDDVEVDGIFGARTERALVQFQRKHGFPADGVAGPRTWDALVGSRSADRPPPPAPPDAEVKRAPPPEGRSAHELALSRSLTALLTWFADPVDAWAIADRILETHPNYLSRSKARVRLKAPEGAAQHSIDEWLLSVRELVDEELVPELHTRQVLRGLALLEPELGKRLEDVGVMEVVREKPLGQDGILSQAGRARLGVPERARTAPTLLDRPAREDRLGREVFAITLAARLVQLRGAYVPVKAPWRERLTRLIRRDETAEPEPQTEVIDGPFLVHLQGAWGAGKSTLLNFFAKQLERPSHQLQDAVWGPRWPDRVELDRWVVVTFNAWQHQRIAPPWWWLMTELYQKGAAQLRKDHPREWLRFKLRDYRWRFKTRWPAFVVPLIAVAGVSVLVWALATQTSAFTATGDKTLVEFLGSVAGALTAIVGLVAAGWGAVRAVKRWMLVGTARGADQFMKTTADPMAAVQLRYEHLVKSLGHPVAVFIDDLDRCKAAYVVELLEGIQTLFSRAPVTYVVAADSCWLRESFLQVYEPFATSGTGPGPMLGYGFLDKSFQLSTSVPRMRPDSRSNYLASMLGARRATADGSEARRRVAQAADYAEVRQVVADSRNLSDEERRAVREAAALRAAGADVVAETQHLLQDFEDLLEPNPRAMKRLVNAYGFESRLRLLESDWVEEDLAASQRLALWTIVKLRWPPLGDYLAEHPEQVDKIGPRTALGSVPEGLRPYFRDDEVRRVVRGEAAALDVRLDADTLRAMIRPAPVLVPPS